MGYLLVSFLCLCCSLPGRLGATSQVASTYWSATPFSLNMLLSLAFTGFILPISNRKANVVLPVVVNHLFGEACSTLVLAMLLMDIVSTGLTTNGSCIIVHSGGFSHYFVRF